MPPATATAACEIAEGMLSPFFVELSGRTKASHDPDRLAVTPVVRQIPVLLRRRVGQVRLWADALQAS